MRRVVVAAADGNAADGNRVSQTPSLRGSGASQALHPDLLPAPTAVAGGAGKAGNAAAPVKPRQLHPDPGRSGPQ